MSLNKKQRSESNSVRPVLFVYACLLLSVFVSLYFAEKSNYIKRVAGESLFISLEGINPNDATLSFSGEYANVTLVRITQTNAHISAYPKE